MQNIIDISSGEWYHTNKEEMHREKSEIEIRKN